MKEREKGEVGRQARWMHRSWWSVSVTVRLLLMLSGAVLGLLLFWNAHILGGCWARSGCLKLLRDWSIRANQERFQEEITETSFIHAAVSFPSHVLLLINPTFAGELSGSVQTDTDEEMACLYNRNVKTKVVSIDRVSVRCEHPADSLQATLEGKPVSIEISRGAKSLYVKSSEAYYGLIFWKKVVYNMVEFEDERDVLLFAKGIVETKKGVVPKDMECIFGDGVHTKVTAGCQENFRCSLPPNEGRSSYVGKMISLIINGTVFPSVVRYYPSVRPDQFINPRKNVSVKASSSNRKVRGSTPLRGTSRQIDSNNETQFQEREKSRVCACTMVWNGAKSLKEWVIFHGHLGVERFFIYDNNSDDDLQLVIKSLQSRFNVTRHAWPWLKTQEAGFSHCALMAMPVCDWMAFLDLDEFIFPRSFISRNQVNPGDGVDGDLLKVKELKTQGRTAHYNLPVGKYAGSSTKTSTPIQLMLDHYDTAAGDQLGQLKVPCFTFGPSGFVSLPSSGQMVNYVCRMRAPKRVKSIVRLEAMAQTLCSRVHYFDLKEGYQEVRASLGDVVVHHYKYQVWEDFESKFVHRAATFISDWGEESNMANIDRTAGLGTKAVEPPGWAHRFCEVNETALREYALHEFRSNQHGNKLIWESPD